LSLLALISMGSSVSLAAPGGVPAGKPDVAANLEIAEALLIYNALKVAFEMASRPTLEWVTGETEERSYIEEVEEGEVLDPDAGQGQVEPEDVEDEVDLSHLPEDVREDIYRMRRLLRPESGDFLQVLDLLEVFLQQKRVELNDVMDIIRILGNIDIDNIRWKRAFVYRIPWLLPYVSEGDKTQLRELLRGFARDSRFPSVQLRAIEALATKLAKSKPTEAEWELIVTTLQTLLKDGLPVRGADGEYDGFEVLQALVTDHGYRDDLVRLLRELVRDGSGIAPFQAIKILAKNNLTEEDWELVGTKLQAFLACLRHGGSVPTLRARAALGAFLALPYIPQDFRDEALERLRVIVGDGSSPVRLEAIEVLASHNPTEEDWKLILVVLENLLNEGQESTCEQMAEVLGRLLSSQPSLPEDCWSELWSLLKELSEDGRLGVVCKVIRFLCEVFVSPCIQPVDVVEVFRILFGVIGRYDNEVVDYFFKMSFKAIRDSLASVDIPLERKKKIFLSLKALVEENNECCQRVAHRMVDSVLKYYGLREALADILKEAPEAGPGEDG